MKKIFYIGSLLAIMAIVFVLGTVSKVPTASAYYADDGVQKYATSTSFYITSGSPVTIANVSQGRSYMEISNISGATSTAQVISCAINGETPVLYKGITLFASTTRTWNKDSIPLTQIKCISVTGGTITFIEK